MKFSTIMDVKEKLAGKKVFVRVDTNATLVDGAMPYTERVQAAFETVQYLTQNGAAVIVGAHNGREGEPDFVSVPPLFMLMAEREKKLPKLICVGNTYDANRAGLNDDAVKKIKGLKNGEIFMLENLRFLAQETASLSRADFAKTKIVQDLVQVCGVSYFVLDGFSVAHRAQLSVVGFPQIPNLAGLQVKKELEGASRVVALLEKNKTGQERVTFILGGAKIQDYFTLIEKNLASGTVGKIVVGGLMSQLCLFAKGYDLGEPSKRPLEKKDAKGKSIWDYQGKVKALLEKHPNVFVLPVDVAYEGEDGGRREFPIDNLPAELKKTRPIYDIGQKTIALYQDVLGGSSMAYWKGPLGAFDKNPAFKAGSEEILKLLKGNRKIFSVMGGGDTAQMLAFFGVKAEEIGYLSLAGGALLELLAGEKLPGIQALEESCQQFPTP